MRPPLSSRSSTKPRGSKIRACSHSDLGEFLLWWRSCYGGEKIKKILVRFLEFPSVKFLKIWQRSYSLLPGSFPCFQFIRKICKTRFSLSQNNTKMLKTKKLPRQPLLFSILKVSSWQTTPVLSIAENSTEGNWRKLKSKPKRCQKLAMFECF